MFHTKLFFHFEIVRKKPVFLGCKSQIFIIGDKMQGLDPEWRRLEYKAKGVETVLRGLEFILHTRRLRKSFVETTCISNLYILFYL